VTITDADGRVFHCVQIAKVSPAKWSATYGDIELGVWRDPEHCAARRLLDPGLASRDDMLRTFHGAPAMRGSIAWWADTTAADPSRGSPHIERWSPFDRAEDAS
jgi:hypothetical protein